MYIEEVLNSLLAASERQATALEGMLKIQTRGQIPDSKLVDARATPDEPTYAEKRKAEVKEEVKAAAAAEEKKPRGRPVGSTKPKETPPVVEPETEEDPFAVAEEPVVEAEKPVTLEDLRKVLVDMRAKIGKDKAYAVLRDAGKGASYLVGSTAGGAEPGGPGELKPENYAAVIKAARKAMA